MFLYDPARDNVVTVQMIYIEFPTSNVLNHNEQSTYKLNKPNVSWLQSTLIIWLQSTFVQFVQFVPTIWHCSWQCSYCTNYLYIPTRPKSEPKQLNSSWFIIIFSRMSSGPNSNHLMQLGSFQFDIAPITPMPINDDEFVVSALLFFYCLKFIIYGFWNFIP